MDQGGYAGFEVALHSPGIALFSSAVALRCRSQRHQGPPASKRMPGGHDHALQCRAAVLRTTSCRAARARRLPRGSAPALRSPGAAEQEWPNRGAQPG